MECAGRIPRERDGDGAFRSCDIARTGARQPKGVEAPYLGVRWLDSAFGSWIVVRSRRSIESGVKPPHSK